jgi:aldose 1-epimerase
MGFGLHPYFADRSAASIKAQVPAIWRWDHERMPVSKEANPDAENLASGRGIGTLPVTAEYQDWDGSATVEWPEKGICVNLETHPPLRHAVMWIPAGREFFCFEPVSHATDGLNRLSTQDPVAGFRILEPGAGAEQEFAFVVSAADSSSS